MRELAGWIVASVLLIALVAQRTQPCPYVWHGGSPTGEPRGCWVGNDGYAMCTPSLAIELVIESGDDAVVLVRRGDNGKYATMGGFVDVGEDPRDAVARGCGGDGARVGGASPAWCVRGPAARPAAAPCQPCTSRGRRARRILVTRAPLLRCPWPSCAASTTRADHAAIIEDTSCGGGARGAHSRATRSGPRRGAREPGLVP